MRMQQYTENGPGAPSYHLGWLVAFHRQWVGPVGEKLRFRQILLTYEGFSSD